MIAIWQSTTQKQFKKTGVLSSHGPGYLKKSMVRRDITNSRCLSTVPGTVNHLMRKIHVHK